MHASEMDQALGRLESATAALLQAGFSDLSALSPLLDRRASAIEEVASLLDTALAAQLADTDLLRLSSVIIRGEEARRRILAERSQAAGEWTRLSAIRHNMGSPAELSYSTVDVDF